MADEHLSRRSLLLLIALLCPSRHIVASFKEVAVLARKTVSMLAVAGLTLSACASADVIQTSANTAVIQSSAAPACGASGSARVAQKEAAAATLRAGYDRYIITSVQQANNVQTFQGAGTFNTVAVAGGGYAGAGTSYTPGPIITAGSHDTSFGVIMFRENEPGARNAIAARSTLGPQWQTEMNRRTTTCSQGPSRTS